MTNEVKRIGIRRVGDEVLPWFDTVEDAIEYVMRNDNADHRVYREDTVPSFVAGDYVYKSIDEIISNTGTKI